MDVVWPDVDICLAAHPGLKLGPCPLPCELPFCSSCEGLTDDRCHRAVPTYSPLGQNNLSTGLSKVLYLRQGKRP
jgi:hypothetical protein